LYRHIHYKLPDKIGGGLTSTGGPAALLSLVLQTDWGEVELRILAGKQQLI